MASIDSKWLPRNGNFSFGNRTKPYGAISDEYCGWSMTFIAFLALNSITIVALCDSTLLSCKIHELFFHKTGRFWRILSRKRYKGYMLSLLSWNGDYRAQFSSLFWCFRRLKRSKVVQNMSSTISRLSLNALYYS